MTHPEDICQQCQGNNVTWFTSNKYWNEFARQKDGRDPMLCPVCFILAAEKKGLHPSSWMVVPIMGDKIAHLALEQKVYINGDVLSWNDLIEIYKKHKNDGAGKVMEINDHILDPTEEMLR